MMHRFSKTWIKTIPGRFLVQVRLVVLVAVGIGWWGIPQAKILAVQGGGYSLQVGSTSDETAARSMVAQLKAAGHYAYYVRAEIPGKGVWYRIRVGKFTSSGDAQRYGRGLRSSSGFVTGFEGPSGAPFSSVPASITGSSTPKTPKPDSVKKTPTSQPGTTAPDTTLSKPTKPVKLETTKKTSSPPKQDRNPEVVVSKPIKPDPLKKTPVPQPQTPNPQPQPSNSEIALNTLPDLPERSTPKSLPPRLAFNPVPKSINLISGRNSLPAAPVPPPSLRQAVRWLPPTITLTTPPPGSWLFPASPISDARGWKRQFSPTNTDLSRVFFVDSQNGWASGMRGMILQTTDGGTTWMEQNSQTRSSITDLFFSDTQHGWALCGGTLGSQGRDLREEQVLLKTEDGGKSWHHAVEMDALCVYFVNQKIGFAAGNYGAVLRTENGGKNWVRCASPEKALGKPVKLPEMTFVFTRLQFLDARHGWALGNFYGDGATHTGGLFFTEDAGQTWRKQTLPIATNTGELVNFHFSDLSHGFLVVETYRGDSRYVTLFLTSDGGASWTERKTNMPGYHITTFANPLVGWTAGVAPARQDGPVFEVAIWRTNDGGATWYEETSLIEGKLYDVFFLDPSHGWAVGEGGMILSYRF